MPVFFLELSDCSGAVTLGTIFQVGLPTDYIKIVCTQAGDNSCLFVGTLRNKCTLDAAQ